MSAAPVLWVLPTRAAGGVLGPARHIRPCILAGGLGLAAAARRPRCSGQTPRAGRRRCRCASPKLLDGETVAVVGAGGNVGRLVAQSLCEAGKYKVRGVLRDPDAARSGWAANVPGCELFAADTRDYAALAAALADAQSVVCTTGVPAFGFSGQWENGNHPESVDHYGVKNAVHAWMSGAPATEKRRFVLMSSIGVNRRTGFPYAILNGGGVLDAKARGEEAVISLAKEKGFATAIVRPGQLFGGPYENNRYLGTLFQLDKDVSQQAVKLVPGDTAVGDALRSTLAGVLVRCLFAEAPSLDFAVVNEEGQAPTGEDIDTMLADVAQVAEADGADEDFGRRLELGTETFGKAAQNVASGKIFDQPS